MLSAGTPKAFQLLNDPDAAAGGDYKFDPLGFGGGKMMEEKELANGRIAMLAFAGWVAVDLGFRVPFAPDVSSLYAHDACVERGPMLGLLIPLTAIELLAGERAAAAAATSPAVGVAVAASAAIASDSRYLGCDIFRRCR